MRALVTGATGFVGRYLIKLLISHGYNVCGTFYHLPSDCNNLSGVHLENVDITDKTTLRRVIKNFLPDEVYHLAGVAVTHEVDKEVYYSTNFLGTNILLDAIREIVPNCRVLIIGSAHAYGMVEEDYQPIREEQELRPNTHYAAAKAAADMVACAYAAEGLYVVRARPFNHTGPGQSTGFVCSRLAKLVAEVSLGRRTPMIKVGNIETVRDFTDVRDVVEAYWLLMQKGRQGEAYNVCSQKGYTIKEIITILTHYARINIQLKTDSDLLRESDIPVLIGSREKIFRHTEWEPKILFENTLLALINYWKNILANTNKL